MPIIELQRRLAQAGRIRLGHLAETRNGGKRPASLTTFRLTSSDRTRLEEVADVYGGTVAEWESPAGRQFEVITETDRLPVVVPPAPMAFSQWYELWSAAGCQRRCTGEREILSDQPCLCDPDRRQCVPHTRLSVMLRDLSGLGTWRVDSTGWNAATELGGVVDVITLAAERGTMLPAVLRLEQRTDKRPDEGTRHFVVPVLDVSVTPAQLLAGTGTPVEVAAPAYGATRGQETPPEPEPEPALPVKPAPTDVHEGDQNTEITEAYAPPVPRRSLLGGMTRVPDNGERPASIADQVKGADNIPSRRRAAPIPSTGTAPRTAVQVAASTQRMITAPQITKLVILLKEAGFVDGDEGRAARLKWCADQIGREISSSKELTLAEASKLIEQLARKGS
jgi:hypothetical protein